MSQVAASALLLVLLPAGVVGRLLGAGPALLVPRRQRFRYRRWRKTTVIRPLRQGRRRQSSSQISKRMRKIVLAADRNRCIACSARKGEMYEDSGGVIRQIRALQVDHRVPWSLGGYTWLLNLAALCPRCNQVKSNYFKAPDGRVLFRNTWYGQGAKAAAAAIYRTETIRCHSPARWLRAALALA